MEQTINFAPEISVEQSKSLSEQVSAVEEQFRCKYFNEMLASFKFLPYLCQRLNNDGNPSRERRSFAQTFSASCGVGRFSFALIARGKVHAEELGGCLSVQSKLPSGESSLFKQREVQPFSCICATALPVETA